ncbi:serine/arginine repetitive matrix protein 1-like [Leguminivora glycinivorella]|uniref:serine/arginine repetitive matrix protein 1-like n=1 Tax=Leguminivora glycinivorella TaxID=1035111 RepID=UPI00200D8F01|nr:serine/arginine repetitive matrix protein 1-like [Leguminivora glycinivorella]
MNPTTNIVVLRAGSMQRTPIKIETRRSKARRLELEKRVLEDQQKMSQKDEKSEAPHGQSSTARLEEFEPVSSIPRDLVNTKPIEGSVKSEPTAAGFLKKTLPPSASYVSKASSSKGSRMSSASRTAKKKQLLLEAAKQKAAIQMEIIDKTLDAQLAELDDEDQEYGSHVSRRSYSRSHVADWVENQSNLEPQEDQQQAPEYGLNTGELHQHAPRPPPELGPAPRATAPAPAPALGPAAPLPPPPPPDGTVMALQSAIQVMADAVKNISTANTPNTSLLSRLSTPIERSPRVLRRLFRVVAV